MLFLKFGHRLAVCCLTLSLLVAGCASSKHAMEEEKSPYIPVIDLEKEDILHVPTGIKVSFDSLIDAVSDSRVVYVGESHDNLEQHRVQLEILRAMEARYPGRIAVGMEMFTRPSQAVLDRWVKGELTEKEMFREWGANWGFDYEYYKAILEFIRDKRIPLVALNAPKELARELSKKGMAGLTEKQRGELPEIDDKDPYYRAVVEAIYEDHAHGSGIERFFQVQLLWDETMAESVAGYLKNPVNRDKKMVVLAGGGHVQYGLGIPKRAFRRYPTSYSIVMPITPRLYSLEKSGRKGEAGGEGGHPRMMNIDMPDLPLLAADFMWAVDYKGLEAGRVMMGVQVSDEGGRVNVQAVAPNSAADRAGLKAGDVVIKLDGEEAKAFADLTYALRSKKVGDKLRVDVERSGAVASFELEFMESDRR